MKKTFFKIDGIEKVMQRINKVLKRIELDITSEGFIRVSMYIRQKTENEYPKTPLYTGNLRASYFTVIKGKGNVNTGNYPLIKPNKVDPKDKALQRTVVSMMKGVSNSINYPNMIFGFSANYAAPVHEDMEAKNWNRSNSGPKYFQLHLQRNRKDILHILAKSARKS